MASPFSVFRRNQKMMLALLTILAMFGFVFLPMIMEFLGARSGGSQNPVFVKTKAFGNLKHSDVEILRQQHQQVKQALTAIQVAALTSEQVRPSDILQQFLGLYGPATETVVVNRWLLAKQAEKQGIVVSDDMIKQFLQAITEGRVPANKIQLAIQQAGLSVRQFFQAMRSELAANDLQTMIYTSTNLFATTPGQRWDFFNRLKRSASIEAVAVPVADFTKQVETPTDKELEKFFEQHKNQYPIPTSPEPGFRKAPTVALQYVKFDDDKLQASVTDDEIKQEYEKNKELYDQFFQRLDAASKAAAQPANDTASKTETKPAAEQQPAPEKQPATDQKPAAEAKPTTEPKKQEVPKDSEKKSDAADKKSNATTSYHASSVMLVSLTEDAAPADTKKPETKPAEAAKAAEHAKEPAKEPAKKADAPVDTPKTPEKAATSGKPATEKQPAATEKAPTASEQQPAAKAAEAPASIQGGFTDQQKNLIRSQVLANKRRTLLAAIQKPVDDYRQQYNDYVAQATTDKTATPPKPLNLEQLAKDHGMAFGETPLVAEWELKGTEVGSALVEGRMPVASIVFGSFSSFRPVPARDSLGNMYLIWKSKDTKDQVPKFDDPGVKEQVLAAWKIAHARDAAKKQATTLADEAIKAKKPLAEVFAKKAGVDVITPPPFTWMTTGSVAMGNAELSTIPQIALTGEDFMRAVFGLYSPGDVTVAFNAPKTVAYVVRLKEFTPPFSLLWEVFQRDSYRNYASAGQPDIEQVYQAWLKGIKAQAGYEWVAPHAIDSGRNTSTSDE